MQKKTFMVRHRSAALGELGGVPADDILGIAIIRHGWQMNRGASVRSGLAVVCTLDMED